MPYQVVGKSGITKVFSAAASPGTTISFAVPIKSFVLKPVGGNITFKFDTAETDANAFPVNDGESIQFDLSMAYESNVAIVGYAIGAASVSVYVAGAY